MLRTRRTSSAGVPYVEPIIPVERSHPFDDPDWLFEPKYHGFCGIAYIAGGCGVIHSKRGTRVKRFASLSAALPQELLAETAVLDGEVLAVDAGGQPQFADLDMEGIVAKRRTDPYARGVT